METSKLQWHPAFFAALQIELEDEDVPLQFTSEFNLTKKPLQIDVLVVKKESDKTLKKNFVKLFRGHNVIEYKGEGDYLSINDFYKAVGYACIYQSNTVHVMEINPSDITVTLACNKFPRKLIKHLKQRYHSSITKPYPGVYYISGTWFPVQLWVLNKLSKKETLWLNSLRSDLTSNVELLELENIYREHKHNPNYETAMDVIVRANQILLEGEPLMCNALREFFAKDFEEREEKGKMLYAVELICKKLSKNKSIQEISAEIEEPLELTAKIYSIAQKYAPNYDIEQIYQEFIATS